MSSTGKRDPRVISYISLRRIVGILGIAFPMILVAGSILLWDCKEVQSSISAYYHTHMRNVFVGVLSAISLFMFAYRGYGKTDAHAGTLAGVFALGVAFLPTSLTDPLTSCIPDPIENGIVGTLHNISAIGLFLVLGLISIFLFTRSSEIILGEMKRKRNWIYRTCGILIILCIALILIYSYFETKGEAYNLSDYNPVFWLETAALWAFGLSWLTKGSTILLDK